MNNGREPKGRSQEENFYVLYNAYNKSIYYSAFSITKEHYLAQDVVQETFLKAYRLLDDLIIYQNKEGWLKRTARNIAIDLYRRRRREIPDSNAAVDAGAIEPEIIKQYIEKEFIGELLSQLNPLQRQTLTLVYEYGYSHEQIACLQQTTVSAVKSVIHRTKRKLRHTSLQVGEPN
ncbi:RNA polymerase sigma factor [Cohnella phaseoli]|uniref:RNA polymerase sigma-70 factor (ECF subfamily) n=1 Tax=Cohnella phaseoli TaxID=456490 RepID=A0A3D9JLW1_9BACL|nr:RNA polymerase sigma factor [Cohnella phaseoli]RED75091.1 RNA polymerase sigma-70 factor (ECF subfamily) [Cohnella phaseoli]